MKALPGNSTLSPTDRIQDLTRAIDFCKTFINADSCNLVSIMFSVKGNQAARLAAYSFGNGAKLPVPKEAFYNFFYELAQTLTEERLELLMQNPEV